MTAAPYGMLGISREICATTAMALVFCGTWFFPAAAEPIADQGLIRMYAVDAVGIQPTNSKFSPLPPAMEQGLQIARLLEEGDDQEWRLFDMRCMGSRRDEVLAPLLLLSKGPGPVRVGEHSWGIHRK